MSASAGRVLIILKGEYNSAAQYQMLDAVRYNGSLYIAKKATSGNTPQDGEYWMLCATGSAWGDINGDITRQVDLMALLNGKEDSLTFDTTPMASSLNPVTSGGIKTALDAKMPNPSGGVTGDVLVKTATGVDWDTLSASDVALGTGTVEDLAGSVATIELSPALYSHAVGGLLLWNGKLYKATSAISAGESLVVGTNISEISIGSEIASIHSDITSLNNGLSHKQNTLTITSLTSTVVGSGVTINSQSIALYGKVLQFSIDVTLASQISQYGSIVSLGGKSAAAGWCYPLFSAAFVPSSQYAIYGDLGNQNIRAAQTLPAGRYRLIGMILTT